MTAKMAEVAYIIIAIFVPMQFWCCSCQNGRFLVKTLPKWQLVNEMPEKHCVVKNKKKEDNTWRAKELQSFLFFFAILARLMRLQFADFANFIFILFFYFYRKVGVL